MFDTGNGFRAVWHLNGTGDESDATADRLLATQTGTPTVGAGVTGPGRTFNGSNQYFTLLNSANGPLNFHLTDNFTMSAWVNIAAVPPGRNAGLAIINKGDNQWTMEAQDTSNLTKYWLIEVRGNNNFLYARSDGTPKITANSGIGIWHHLTGTFHGAAIGQADASRALYLQEKRLHRIVDPEQLFARQCFRSAFDFVARGVGHDTSSLDAATQAHDSHHQVAADRLVPCALLAIDGRSYDGEIPSAVSETSRRRRVETEAT